MGRSFSLLGVVMFTVGVVALSSLARRTQYPLLPPLPDEHAKRPDSPPRRVIPMFAYDSPFSLN
jgi:hypothetical protein